MNSVILDELGNLSTFACCGLYLGGFILIKIFFLGGCIDLGFRVEEEKVKAPNWLWFNEFFLKILLFIYGYLVEKVCGAFWFLIGKRKVLIGGCKEEGKKRNICCLRSI